jgi:UTP--glucose-1-phosphate uridylyltransferase
MWELIKKVVIPAAGLGTRLLTATKEIPKELLPVFDKGFKGAAVLKPMLQIVFERLYSTGFREFCFIVGRGKRAVADHFTKDEAFTSYIRSKNKEDIAEELEIFYRKIVASKIVMVNQPEPKGFGDAVAKAEVFTSNEPFLVHAGDDLILSSGNSHISRLVKVFEEKNADAVLLVHRVQDPSRYGVVTGVRVRPRLYKVIDIVEKPRTPTSNLATIAIYAFRNVIYEAIRNTEADENGEVQLTDAIKQLILAGGQVYAVELYSGEKRIDIGNVESYWAALRETFQRHKGEKFERDQS